jgi:hypothetical protein
MGFSSYLSAQFPVSRTSGRSGLGARKAGAKPKMAAGR